MRLNLVQNFSKELVNFSLILDQQKTRFGATPAIKLNDQSLVENKREKIFDSKQKVLEDLIS